jgi:radical SAM protein with 4Fe4S-binding SPASM domain
MSLSIGDIYRKAARATIPIAAHFDLTYRCNLNCIHCYLPEKDRYPSLNYVEELKEQNRAELTTGEVYGVLDQLAECGTLFLNLSGGEIFVRHDILDIVGYARKKRFNVSLMTTGTTGIDEDVADKVADMGIHFVDISIYSSESEVHDSVTRSSNSFNKTIKTVELFRERGIKLRFKCPVMKNNVETYKGVAALAESYGAIFRTDPNITVRKDGDKRPTYLGMDDNELEKYFAFLVEMDKRREEKKEAEVSDPLCDDPLNEIPIGENPCSASHSTCYISPYGDVQPCIDINMICGNLREMSFEEIWKESPEMLSVRAIKKGDLKKCPDCPEPDYCHRCMGQSYVEHGNLLFPSEVSCRTIKMRRQILKGV